MIETTAEPIQAILDRLNAKAVPMSDEERRLRQERLDARQQAERRARICELVELGHAPKRHREKKDLSLDGQWGTRLAELSGRLGCGFLVALVGTRGNGKTQLAVELMRRTAEKFKTPRFCTAVEFFMDIKAGYTTEETTERGIILEFCKPSLLIMDEIGVRSENDWENRLLQELLNRRYNAVQDTLLISNQTATELKLALGPSLSSRMKETGGIIPCEWPSFR